MGTTVLLVLGSVRSRLRGHISHTLLGTATALHVADYKDTMFWWGLVMLVPVRSSLFCEHSLCINHRDACRLRFYSPLSGLYSTV